MITYAELDALVRAMPSDPPKMIGCCPATANFYGRKARGRETRKNHGDEIMRRYANGESTDAIGKSIGATGGLVKAIIRERGGHIRTISEWKRRYKLNERFFETIDTEEKAYFLGFMYADGCVHPDKGTVTLTQAKPDADMLEKFRLALESDAPIQEYIKKNSPNSHPTSMLNLGSRLLIQDLQSHGCIKAKTFKTKFPYDSMPPSLYRHFVRGYFDGDGSICKRNKRYISPNATLVGTQELLDGIIGVASKQLCRIEHKFYVRHPERNHNITQLFIGRQVDALRFLWWLYDGASVYMQRKMDRYTMSFEYMKLRLT